jgi:hypothetical protein
MSNAGFRRFRWRAFVAFGMLFSLLATSVAGVIQYPRPEGSLASWTRGSVLGIDKKGGERVHFPGGQMSERSLFAVAVSAMIFAVVHVWPGSAEAKPQGQAVPAWVSKGAEAFPEFRGRYLFATAKIEGVKDAGRDASRLDAYFRTQDSAGEALRTMARGVVEAYGKAALAKPLDDAASGELIGRCAEKAAKALGVEEGRFETYFDEKTRTMHAILLVEVCVGDDSDDLLTYSVFLVFNEELEPIHEANGLQMEAKAASKLLSGLVRAEGIKIGLTCWKK